MAAIALHFMHYNFARIHKTLRVTPAMEAGVSPAAFGASRKCRACRLVRGIGVDANRRTPQ
jgi:hypothetical protein